MKRKIALAALLSTLAISGLAIGGDSGASDGCDPSWCPPGCEPCCETACAVDADAGHAGEAGSACSLSR